MNLPGQKLEARALFRHGNRPPLACPRFSYWTPLLFPPLALVNDATTLLAKQTPTPGDPELVSIWSTHQNDLQPSQVASWLRTMGLRNDSFSFLEAHWHSLPEVQYKSMRSKYQPVGRLPFCLGLSFLICVIKLTTRTQHLPGDLAVDCGESTLSKPGLIKSHTGGTVTMWKRLREAGPTIGNVHGSHGVSL